MQHLVVVAGNLRCDHPGGDGVITEGVRDEQRKIIQYNHLVANLLIFHTLVTMSRALQCLADDGYAMDMEALATLSPYQTEHLNDHQLKASGFKSFRRT